MILDGNVHSEDDCFRDIEDYLDKVLCVGISALSGPEIASGLRFAAMIREKSPKVPIVWGGWHVSCLPEESIQNPYVDAIVIGLGQKIFPEIIRRISEGNTFDDLEGVVTIESSGQIRYKQRVGKFDLCDSPLPAFDMLDLELYRRESLALLPYPEIDGLKLTGYLYYVTSFGCPFACAFCSNNLIFNHCWYGYSINAVVDQLGYLITEKGFNCVGIIDAEFFHQIERVEYFCDEITKRGYKFVWDAQASVKSIIRLSKKGLLTKLRKAGCWRMNIGVETGSEEMLKYINKKIHVEDIIECANALKDSGITGSFNFLFGLPPEKQSDLLDSFSLAYHLKKISPDSSLPISFYTPFSGTPIFNDALKAGFVAPKTLDGWGNYKTSYITLAGDIPWRNAEREKLVYDVLTFYLPIAVPGNIRRGTITMFKQKLEKSTYRILLHLASKIADYRMKNMDFRFRFERTLYDLYCSLFKKQYYKSGKWFISDDN
ncbi:MAG: B12-binding domain-containing radical SAM protein [Desulfobacteraceae bacterium]|nr:B12-binding domain-containing radical SAM protein [Desulfobacteraceae bacterium]